MKHIFLLNILSLNQSRGVSKTIVTQLFLPKSDFTNAISMNCETQRHSKYKPRRDGTHCPCQWVADTQQC